MAYKGSNGEVMEYASSSSVAPASSSSVESSSSVQSSSSEAKSSSSEAKSSSSEEVSSSSEAKSSSSQEDVESSSSEQSQAIAVKMQVASPMRYIASESRLEINADVRRLNIFDVNGHVVKMSTEAVSQSSVDLSSLKPGIYLVRLVAGGKAYQQKIVKR